MRHYHIKKNLFNDIENLKNEFNSQFSIPYKQYSLDRCVWDYFHVDDQFNAHITPANNIFKKSTLNKFEKTLLSWIYKNLGCTEINSMWCSNYTHSCGQNFHMDINHGMWAYVYSLTDWDNREFTGGETVLLKPEILNFWQNITTIEDIIINSATDRVYSKIAPKLNQLLFFDSRIPHGVETVMGTSTITKGRTVIHGWIKTPKLHIRHKSNTSNSIEIKLLTKINPILTDIFTEYAKLDVYGVLVVKTTIHNGKVKSFILPSTVHLDDKVFKKLSLRTSHILKTFFQKSQYRNNEIIIPIVFNGRDVYIQV